MSNRPGESSAFVAWIAGAGVRADVSWRERVLNALADLGEPILHRSQSFGSDWVACFGRRGVDFFDAESLFGACISTGPDGAVEEFARNGTADSRHFEYCAFISTPGDGSVRLFRDHVGTRPLYFGRFQGGWLIASEIRALLAAAEELVADLRCVSTLLQPAHAFRTPLDRSGVYGIWRVPPAHCVWLFHTGEVCFERYWHPDRLTALYRVGFDEAVEETRRLFLRAVEMRSSGAQVGCHVSGGLDSTTIALAITSLSRSVQGFSWTMSGYSGLPIAELARIRAVGRTQGLQVSLLDERALSQARLELLGLNPVDYPQTSLALELAIMRQARTLGVQRMLSGWGGDEFASYGVQAVACELMWKGRWWSVARNLWRRDGESVRKSLERLGTRLRWELLIPLKSLRKGTRRPSLNCASENLKRRYPVGWSAEEMLEVRGSVRQLQLSFLGGGFLAERMESWWCHGQRHGLEYCYPMLDRDLLEFVLRLPAEFFFGRGVTRLLFREVAKPFWAPLAVDGDLKDDACLHARFRELGPFQDTCDDDGKGLESFVDLDALAKMRSQNCVGCHKVEFALALLRRCGGRARHWAEAEKVACIH